MSSVRAHTPPSPSAPAPTKKPKLDLQAPAAVADQSQPSQQQQPIQPQPIKNAPPPGPRKVNVAGKKRGKPKRKPVDEVVLNEIKVFLGPEAVAQANAAQLDWDPPVGLERGHEVVVRCSGELTAHGSALARFTDPATSRTWALSIPFALPTELVRVRVDASSRLHSTAELLEVLERSEERLAEGEGVGCRYFGKCGGCQFQHLSYARQLELKRGTVERAFKYFSKLDPARVPEIGPTMPSPKQVGYRTKITPHFRPLPTAIRESILTKANLPLPPRKGTNPYAAAHAASSRGVSRAGSPEPQSAAAAAAAAAGGGATEVNDDDEEAGLNDEPLHVVGGVEDALEQQPPAAPSADGGEAEKSLIEGLDGGVDGGRFFQRVVTAEGERGGEAEEEEGLHEFFIGFDERVTKKLMDIEECPLATPVINAQYAVERRKITRIAASYAKDASLLLRDSSDPASFAPPQGEVELEDRHVCVTDHRATVHERVGNLHFAFPAGSFFQNNNSILPSLTSYVERAIFDPPTSTTTTTTPSARPTHLVDTYCGSGLFAISLSHAFDLVTGIEVDPKSIAHAERNAKLNGVEGKCTFKAGKSEEIFQTVVGLPWDRTAVVIDPPRKGCDEGFLRQLVAVAPQTVVYVSCNVHTQARDVGFVLEQEVAGGRRYVLESLRGFDLFPQTAHVEGVAVLRLQ